MAKLIQAIRECGPRLTLGRTAQTAQVAEMIASRTSMNAGEVQNALSEFKAALLFYAKQGSPVKLEGLGTFTPSIDLAGALGLSFRLDVSIDNALNVPGTFKGEIINRENIGKTADDLKDLWNRAHPTDVIQDAAVKAARPKIAAKTAAPKAARRAATAKKPKRKGAK